MQPERRYLTGPITQTRIIDPDNGASEIGGYASVFYDGTPETEYRLWEDTTERIMPGAFDIADLTDVRVLKNHDANLLLGRTSSGTARVWFDERGLGYQVSLGDTGPARDAIEEVRRGDITGASFSWTMLPEDERWYQADDVIVREVIRVRQVFDVGPVTFPAYSGATAEARNKAAFAEARSRCEEWRSDAERAQAEAVAEFSRQKVRELRLMELES